MGFMMKVTQGESANFIKPRVFLIRPLAGLAD